MIQIYSLNNDLKWSSKSCDVYTPRIGFWVRKKEARRFNKKLAIDRCQKWQLNSRICEVLHLKKKSKGQYLYSYIYISLKWYFHPQQMLATLTRFLRSKVRLAQGLILSGLARLVIRAQPTSASKLGVPFQRFEVVIINFRKTMSDITRHCKVVYNMCNSTPFSFIKKTIFLCQ